MAFMCCCLLAILDILATSPALAASVQRSQPGRISRGTTGVASMSGPIEASDGSVKPNSTVYGDCGSSSITGYASGDEMYASWTVASNGVCGGDIVGLELFVNFYSGTCSGPHVGNTVDIIKAVAPNRYHYGTTVDDPVTAPSSGNYCAELTGNVLFTNGNTASVLRPTSVFYVYS